MYIYIYLKSAYQTLTDARGINYKNMEIVIIISHPSPFVGNNNK